MIPINNIEQRLEAYGIKADRQQVERLDRFTDLLIEWNQKINLTAITQPEEVLEKHLIDSLLLEKCVELSPGTRLIDIGCGAGFPSTPLMILHPQICVTQVESISKKAAFLERARELLELPAEIANERAEVLAREEGYREKYDIATARAVCSLNKLAEYCLPFLKVGGILAALKGANAKREMRQAQEAIRILGGQIKSVQSFELSGGEARRIVVIKKISQTSTKYPRNSSRISKNPL